MERDGTGREGRVNKVKEMKREMTRPLLDRGRIGIKRVGTVCSKVLLGKRLWGDCLRILTSQVRTYLQSKRISVIDIDMRDNEGRSDGSYLDQALEG